MSRLTDKFALRPAAPGDLHFVVKSWLRSYANSPYAGAITRERQMSAIKGTIADLHERPGTQAWVACLKDRPNFIVGFVVFEEGRDFGLVHYVYVKDNFRDRGFGRWLVSKASGDHDRTLYTHKTSRSHYLFRDVDYEPALARYETISSSLQRKLQRRSGDRVWDSPLRGDAEGV